MSVLTIHIGLPKTGTTAVQGVLFNNREALARKDIFYPKTFMNNFQDEGRWAHHLHAHKWGGWIDEKDFLISPDDAWQNLARTIEENPGHYIISSERFADILALPQGNAVLEFLVGLFPNVRLRFIVYIRRQDLLAESFLKQRVKVGLQRESMEHYLHDLPAFLDFDALLSRLAEYVGWGNLIVRPYERDKLVDGDAARDFLYTLGLSGFDDEILEPIIANESIRSLTTKVLLEIGGSDALHNSRSLKKIIRDFFEADEFEQLNKLSLLDHETRLALINRYEAGNRVVSDKYQGAVAECLKPPETSPPALKVDQPIISSGQLCRLLERVIETQKNVLQQEFERLASVREKREETQHRKKWLPFLTRRN